MIVYDPGRHNARMRSEQVRRLRNLVRSRPRLTLSLLVGAVVAVSLFRNHSPVTRLLVGWDTAVWLYLLLMGWMMSRASAAQVCGIAEQEDETGALVLAVLSCAALASLVAIVAELSTATAGEPAQIRLFRYLVTGFTVIGTWFFIGVLFTFHYAKMFYQASPERRPFAFPEDTSNPNYWDFLYVSFTIAVASQTADISFASGRARQTALAQMILSFFFNIAVLGLSINVAASVVGK
jgi:uncharacterized membrane protein